jgi:hypothetical protein
VEAVPSVAFLFLFFSQSSTLVVWSC